jgi:hypothetical protein
MESPYGIVSDYASAKITRVWTYLDADEALEAAGLRE